MSSTAMDPSSDKRQASTPARRVAEARETQSVRRAGEAHDRVIGQRADGYEQQADRLAQQLTAAPLVAAQSAVAGDGALAPPLRALFEQRLGADFSKVRIHSDAQAATAAETLRASAYTCGTDVVFGAGRLQPQTAEGVRLLAHELVHVAQQTSNREPMLQRQALPGSGPLISPSLSRTLGSLTLDAFAVDSAAPTALHLAELDEHARTLRHLLSNYPGGSISITGHADAPGTEQHNARLGQQRADAILAVLAQRGIDSASMQTASAGESHPQVPSGGAEGRNRCVIIEFRPPLLPSMLPTLRPPAAPAPRLDLNLRPDFQLPTPPAYLQSPPVVAAPAPNRPRVQLTPGGLAWLDIVVNPPGPTPPEARIAEQFRQHGIPLTDTELRALLDGRAEGIQQLERTLATLDPSMNAGTRSQLARSIADALMGQSLRQQLEREHPTAIEGAQRREREFEDLVAPGQRGPSLEGGVRLRIHF